MTEEPEYFVMQSAVHAKPARVRVVSALPMPTWLTGEKLVDDLPELVEYEVEAGRPGAMKPFYNLHYPLMRVDLLEALESCSVDNLQTFPAVVHDRNTGAVLQNYRAVNIVGVVSAADPDQSQRSAMSDSTMIDASYDSLAIDERKAGGLLLFRLAESVNAVIAHARVRDYVAPRVPGIEFLEPSEWSG